MRALIAALALLPVLAVAQSWGTPAGSASISVDRDDAARDTYVRAQQAKAARWHEEARKQKPLRSVRHHRHHRRR